MSYLENALKMKAQMDFVSAAVPDDVAVKAKMLYPEWGDKVIGKKAEDYPRVTREDKLYKYIGALPYTYVSHYAPGDPGMESLFEVINESHAGTADDPIPYDGNTELIEGLYYTQNGVQYHCVRGTGQPVYHALSDLVGLYVEEVVNG